MSVSNDYGRYGGSFLISQEKADRYIYKNNPAVIGRPDGQFILPSNQMDELLARHPDDPRAWEKQLGLKENSLGEHPIRVDIYSPHDYNIRLPSPELSGSNEYFTGDGMVSGGYNEAVIDQFPNPARSENEAVGRIIDDVRAQSLHLSSQPESPKPSPADLPDRRSEWPVPHSHAPPENLHESAGPSTSQITPQQPHAPSERFSAGPSDAQLAGRRSPAETFPANDRQLAGDSPTQNTLPHMGAESAQKATENAAASTAQDALKGATDAAKAPTGGIT